MKTCLRFAGLALGLVVLSGCGAIAQFQDRIGSAIERYCSEPERTREAYRELINARAAPNRLAVECAGDTPAPAPGE